MTRQFTIKHRDAGAVLFEGRFASMRECAEAAVKNGASLYGASIYGADLRDANLARANLARASLYGARLYGANLYGANLAGADLDGADLDGANLTGAKLRDGCIATGAPLRRATRSDGYEFFLWPTDKGLRVNAGCRWFTYEESWAHWCGPDAARRGTPLGEETEDILVMFSLALDRVEMAS